MCYRLKVRPGPEVSGPWVQGSAAAAAQAVLDPFVLGSPCLTRRSCPTLETRTQGLASFQKQLQCITGMSELDCMQITFQCRAPETCEELNFKGISAFDAAIHCASISAAERQRAVQTAKDIEAAQQQQQQCQHEFQSAQGSGQPQEQVSTSAASPASAVLPHRSHSSRVVPADPAAGQLASAHHLHHHQHQRHSQHERRTTTAAAGLLGVHSQQVEEHSPSVADARVGEPQADPHSCPAQQRSGLRRMQDLLRSLFL